MYAYGTIPIIFIFKLLPYTLYVLLTLLPLPPPSLGLA